MRTRQCYYHKDTGCIGAMIPEKVWTSFDIRFTMWRCSICNGYNLVTKYIW